MKWLVVSTPLLTREGKDEVMEVPVVNLILDNIRKAVLPGSGTTEIFSTLESVRIELQTK